MFITFCFMLISIVCGGSGTRLWPSSRESMPKQFILFDKKESLFQKAVKSYRTLLDSEQNELLIVANIKHKFIIEEQLNQIGYDGKYNIIFEPCSRNTMPVAIMICLSARELGQQNVLFAPSDHLIVNSQLFIEKVIECDKFLNLHHKIATFGLEPTMPHTGYGYIKCAEKIDNAFYTVDKFVEKPDFITAQKYFTDGTYLWNSGIFAMNADVLLRDAEKFDTDIYKQTLKSYNNAQKIDNGRIIKLEDFSAIKEQSIDYGIVEKSDNIITCLCGGIQWNDLGDWSSIVRCFPEEDSVNVTQLNGNNCNVINRSDNIHIATCGVDNVTVVAENDAVIVVGNDNLQDIKQLHKSIKLKKQSLTEQHTFDYRPWGKYEVISDTDEYKIKRIIVKPQMRLSLQLHHKRSEHWICISGKGEATIGDENIQLIAGHSVYIPQGFKHRLINTSIDTDLVIVEVQCGTYFGEDDIVRIQDDWSRG